MWRIKKSADLARQSEPFQASPPQPVARLLVVGDSTGSSSPAQSLAGLIAQAHPSLQIVNRAKDGAKFADIARQLEALGNQRFDAVLVLGAVAMTSSASRAMTRWYKTWHAPRSSLACAPVSL